MKHVRKTIMVLTLAASLGLGSQAFAEMGSAGNGMGADMNSTTTDTTNNLNGTGYGTSGYGTNGAGMTDHLLDRMNTQGTNKTGDGYTGNYNTYSYRANADTTTRGTNWGWLGLLGLLGLAGMRGRNHTESHEGMK